MQAVILVAGEGRRLRPLTEDTPKPMVLVGDVPILEYTLSILPESIDEIILAVGYKKEKIIDYFGDEFNGIPIRYVEQKNRLGTAHALALAKDILGEEPFLFLFGDDLYHQDDLVSLVGVGQPAILVKRSDHPERFGVCLVDERGNLKEILEKDPNPPSDLVNIGAYILSSEIFNIPAAKDDRGEELLPLQIANWAKTRPIKVVEAKFWHPIVYPEDVEAAEDLIPGLGSKTQGGEI